MAPVLGRLAKLVRSFSQRGESRRNDHKIAKLEKDIAKLRQKIATKETKIRKKLGLPLEEDVSGAAEAKAMPATMTLMTFVALTGDQKLEENMRKLLAELQEAIRYRDRYESMTTTVPTLDKSTDVLMPKVNEESQIETSKLEVSTLGAGIAEETQVSMLSEDTSLVANKSHL